MQERPRPEIQNLRYSHTATHREQAPANQKTEQHYISSSDGIPSIRCPSRHSRMDSEVLRGSHRFSGLLPNNDRD
ncbi:UNVERIFIED_CONTAM: hypothetical protein PYX00_002538 [Menopon gallinae]|uniref:Uncharacterized protein n=1 Tax=Menopon gallinae TaxID=328185 RepID=A0AAW2IH90_9NEOP